ncbi:hypothetical protein DSECCO2_270240 [anaerobic digester metagenome]
MINIKHFNIKEAFVIGDSLNTDKKEKNKELKEKSKYSFKYILSDLTVCGEYGLAYRRQM